MTLKTEEPASLEAALELLRRPIAEIVHGTPVFVDDLKDTRHAPDPKWRYNESCHMFTLPDHMSELRDFAEVIRLNQDWLQESSIMPHFDLTRGKRQQAVLHGVTQVNMYIVGAAMKLWREHRTNCDRELSRPKRK